MTPLTTTAALAALVASASVTTTAPDAPDEPVLGPEGYKTLEIGQSGAAAEATGLLIDKQPGPCDRYYLHPDEGEQNVGSGVFIDPDLGVVMIGGTTESHTPEGVGMGTPLADVRVAYPDLEPVPPTDFVYRAQVPGGELTYRFAFSEEDLVSDFALHPDDMGACGDTSTSDTVPGDAATDPPAGDRADVDVDVDVDAGAGAGADGLPIASGRSAPGR